jgi:hypothetical protein
MKLSLVCVVALCALLGAAAPTTAASKGLKVLITYSCDQSDLAAAIKAQPGISGVSTFDDTAATPTAAKLAAADLVVDTGNTCGGHGYKDAVTYGNRLANYVDHGGVVFQAAYDNWVASGAHPTGRFLSGHYAPLSLGPNDNVITTLGKVLKPNSPIVQGLATFTTNYNTTTPLAPGATLLAKWADGRNAIAVKGRVVATSASTNDSPSTPAIARLARNTAKYFNAVPTTRITKATVGASTATFRFKAVGFSTGFQCELKKAGAKAKFKSCPAHKTYSNLKPGSYTFEVAAVGPGGADPTPAKKSFTIAG